MKHTPGPWHAFPLSEYWLIGEASPKPGVHVGRAVTLPNAEANARLMAAAPELLATCEELFRDILISSAAENMDYGDYMRISGLIKKAKGET